VALAVSAQKKRFSEAKYNSNMDVNDLEKYCTLTPEAEEIIQKAFTRLNLSMRAYHKVLKLSRTIADIDGSELIQVAHITEAIMYKFEA
jgi:magnesium chelatase family protein